MFQRFHAMKERKESGFTLIELLVVILIIAILAAIAIPVFLNQRKKGWRAQQESALKNAATAAESFATDNNGDYTGLNLTALIDNGYSESDAVTMSATGTATGYCLTAVHDTLDNTDPSAALAWGTATYDSDVGAPQSADTCT